MPKLLPTPKPGDRFGRWTVERELPDEKTARGWRKPMHLCRCDCGNSRPVASDSLRSGRSTSCGCYAIERIRESCVTHGKSHTPVHAIWNMMKQRCLLPTNKGFKNYGGRGITVCKRWLKFENFLADMGEPPFPGASLERRDNDGPYSKENCFWATRTMQARNKRNNHRFEFRGHNLTLAEWSEHVGIKAPTLVSRVYLYGWPIERALTEPVAPGRHNKEPVVPRQVPFLKSEKGVSA